jgi:hypothetical protein
VALTAKDRVTTTHKAGSKEVTRFSAVKTLSEKVFIQRCGC